MRTIFRVSIALLVTLLLLSALSCQQKAGVKSPFHYIMGKGDFKAPGTPMPEKRKPFQDPDFLTTIDRVTDKKDGYIGPGIQNEYSKMDPENCDGTLLILRGNSAAYYLYRRSTSRLMRQITAFDDCDFAEPEPRWDASNPGLFYYVCNTQLRSYDVNTGRSNTIHDFKQDFPGSALITTKMEGDASLDRRYWCFMVQDSDYNLMSVVCYDRDLDSIVGKKAGGFPDDLNWVGMSMSGRYCIVGYEDVAMYTDVFSRDFKDTVRLPEGSAGHGDAALNKEGRDVYVYQNVRNDYISLADMSTGAETRLLHVPYEVNPDIGLHISGNCAGTPGWALVSTYGSEKPPQGKRHSWMDEQLLMLELEADPRIWRIAHTQSYSSGGHSGEKNYFAEAFAAVNTKGTRLYWGSNWRDYSPDYTDTYRVVLPVDWVREMPREPSG